MTTQTDALQSLITDPSPAALTAFFRAANSRFRPGFPAIADPRKETDQFDLPQSIGSIDFDDMRRLLVVAIPVKSDLTSRSGKGAQYDLAKTILKQTRYDSGIFCFIALNGVFRFSLVAVDYLGTKKEYTSFRRYTYFVDPAAQTNRTFLDQIGKAKFTDFNAIRSAFSIEAVSEDFYAAFSPHFQTLADHVQGAANAQQKQDFALLFIIRIIFLGFVQKKGWLGDDPAFLQTFLHAYRATRQKDQFYTDWLVPLFFEALNSPPGHPVAYGANAFPPQIQHALLMAPYLNGELFKRKPGMDDHSLSIPDQAIADFFDFLFTYNFTIEEAKLDDADLGLNPEFLGIIFERLVNKADGAVYTPRTEVDFMCRMALLQWLHKRQPDIDLAQLYAFFFPSGEADPSHVSGGVFTPAQLTALIDALETVTVCDPAAGSGAFEVGMLQVLEEALDALYARPTLPADRCRAERSRFERKQDIISRSLYGVEVKAWAVWINQLRLWLTLFIDMDDAMRNSQLPLLPNLQFKVRVGDSLVQRIGTQLMPVQGIPANLPAAVRAKIDGLKQLKQDFFSNRGITAEAVRHEENLVFRAILDAQIDGLNSQLHSLDTPPARQTAWLPDEKPTQSALDLTASQRADIQGQIDTLKQQRVILKDDHPFIWSIEFAEIFGDRGGFDIIIGNPPYVRQEQIGDPNGVLSAADYKEALQTLPLLDFPEYFHKSKSEYLTYRKGRKPDGRSDLYTYFYLHSLRLLNRSGVHVFICSNSWLDVGYGVWLQEFFLNRAPLKFIFDNHAKRSFPGADVNTIITIAAAPHEKDLPAGQMVRFVAFKKPFEEVLTADTLMQLEDCQTPQRDELARCYPLRISELKSAGEDPDTQQYSGDKWGGKYLRAPDIYFAIMDKGKEVLGNFQGKIGSIDTGLYSGINEFFYVSKATIEEFHIEIEFLTPLLKGPQDVTQILLETATIQRLFVFNCHLDKNELRQQGKFGALEYILWGEQQSRRLSGNGGRGISWPNVPSVSNRKPGWWAIKDTLPTTVFLQYGYNDRFIHPFTKLGAISDRRYHMVRLLSGIQPEDAVLFINSTLFALFIEVAGRKNLGAGALDLATIDANNLPAIDMKCVKYASGLQRIFTRKILSIFNECGIDPKSATPIALQEPNPLPDRKALDDVVFDALELTPEERKEVYRAVCTLVWERISKADSV